MEGSLNELSAYRMERAKEMLFAAQDNLKSLYHDSANHDQNSPFANHASMLAHDTQAMRNVRNTVATMAIEDMYFDKDFVMELVKIARGEKTSEEVRREILKEYAKS